MGLDANSRGNLRRHLPRTFSYLKKTLGAIDLQGYTKVGDNTDPNLSAMLMGLTDEELKNHTCQGRRNSNFDDCPFIWKEFSTKGYATAYAEDAPWMGAFHYNRKGHVKEPTDFYNRPYFLVSEEQLPDQSRISSNGRICQGEKKSISVIQDYSLAVADALRGLPYFAFYWSASLTHDYLGLASAADEPSLAYLKELKTKGW